MRQAATKKRNIATLNSVDQAKRQCNFDSGWFRDLFSVGKKLEENIFKNINQISSTVTTRTWLLSPECTRTWPSIGMRMKKWWWFPPVCFLVGVVFQGAWVLYRIKKDESDESLLVLAFRRHVNNTIFLKYSKGRQIILQLFRNSKYPIRCFPWLHKTFPGAI